MKRMINKNLSILSEWGWGWGVPMNQTNIKQWAYAHRELIFLNYDLLDTLYQSALYINKISFFSQETLALFTRKNEECIG